MVAQEVINCLDLGLCKVLTQTNYYIAIAIFVLAGIFLLLLFFVAAFTPGFIFLNAKLTKNPLIYIVNRGQSGRFAVGKAKSEGVLDVRGTGPFIITENSHTREHKSGLPLFFSFGEFAATLPTTWIYALNKFRKFKADKKEEIKNVEDLGKAINKRYDEKTGAWE